MAFVGVCVAAIAGAAAPGRAQSTYMSLGDSLAFGFYTPTTTPRSNGDRGYVRPYADWLATLNGGVRPTVVNLAIPGETTASYFSGGQIGVIYNSNYSIFSPDTQEEAFDAHVASEAAAGRTITTVSVQIGVNDLFDLTQTTGFFDLTMTQQESMIDGELTNVSDRYTTLLSHVRATLPDAELIILGYYNPYAAVPDDPLYPLGPYSAQHLNTLIRSLAAQFGGRYVDLYTPFLGHEAEWTLIVSAGDIHPNATGYSMIAQFMRPKCPCERTGDDPAQVDVFDLLAYLDQWFAADPAAELDGTPGVDVFDLLAYLDCWFSASSGQPCP